MGLDFDSNVYDNEIHAHPVSNLKVGELVEVVLSHPHDGEFRYGGYVTQIDSSALYLSPDHPDNPERSNRVVGPLSTQMITEYRTS